jgi:hypothetical protein
MFHNHARSWHLFFRPPHGSGHSAACKNDDEWCTGERTLGLSTFWQSVVLHCKYLVAGDSGDLKFAVLGSDFERTLPEEALSSVNYYMLPALLLFVMINILLAIVFDKFENVKDIDPHANEPWKLENDVMAELQYLMCVAMCLTLQAKNLSASIAALPLVSERTCLSVPAFACCPDGCDAAQMQKGCETSSHTMDKTGSLVEELAQHQKPG